MYRYTVAKQEEGEKKGVIYLKNGLAPSFLTILQVRQAQILGGYRNIDISE